MEHITHDKQQLTILYDAECYLCSNFQKYLQLKQNADIIYKDIHEHSDYIVSLQKQGYDLDHGMIIDINGSIYQGKDAIAEIEKLVDNQNWFDRFMKFCMKHTWIRSLGYPIAQAIRRMLLQIQHIGKNK